MSKKEFKTESKKLLDMMVNSIYTNKEIFLRELISNGSDAIDKRYFKSLTDESLRLDGEYEIRITPNKDERTLTITDNGIGMTEAELEENLGIIAKSGSFDFKENEENKNENIDVIGQFGVGFYSAFMVADKITVNTKAAGSGKAYTWESEGPDGYSITETEKDQIGTEIILHIKADSDDENYTEFLEEYKLRSLIKKYSDYIRYPIKMMLSSRKLKEGAKPEDSDAYETVLEDTTINSITPIWKRKGGDVKDEDYNNFYKDKFHDFEDPIKMIKQSVEGSVSYDALLFIPGHAPFNYYTKDYEKGLQLYSSGVMIMDKCADLLPDYYSFVKGVVDSPDLSLNISRELLQHDRQLKVIAKNLENKITAKLKETIEKDRENYIKFFKAFGAQIKYGIYQDYGMHKDTLQDLLLFTSSFEDKESSLKEYVLRMKDGQDKIYYAAGDSLDQIKMLPQVEAAKAKGYEVLYLTEDIDEFAIQVLGVYEEKTFANVCNSDADMTSKEDQESLKSENESSKDMLDFIKEVVGSGVDKVQFTASLKDHPACISNEGMLSANMEKALNQMPGVDEKVKAELVLEINKDHPVANKLKNLYDSDKEKLTKYAKVLYGNARLVSGLTLDNPAEYSKLVSEIMTE